MLTRPLAMARPEHSITFDVEFEHKTKQIVLSLFTLFTLAVTADCHDRAINYMGVPGLVLAGFALDPPTSYIQSGV